MTKTNPDPLVVETLSTCVDIFQALKFQGRSPRQIILIAILIEELANQSSKAPSSTAQLEELHTACRDLIAKAIQSINHD